MADGLHGQGRSINCELIAVENQTEFVIENASPELLAQSEPLCRKNNCCAWASRTRRPCNAS